MILGLFWFTARDQSEILTLDNDQQQTVGVVGFRWSWAFNYVDQDTYDVGVPYGEGSPVSHRPCTCRSTRRSASG